MNTVGKILVFINLIFSVITGALIVMVFATRTQWQKGYESVAAQLAGERAAHVVTIEGRNTLLAEKNKKVEQAELKLKEASDVLDKVNKDLAASKLAEQNAKDQLNANEALMRKMTAERDNLATELANKDKLITEQVAQINKAELEKKAASESAVKYKIAADSALARAETLLQQYEQLRKEFENLRTDKATRSGTLVQNPPPEDVKGTIKATDATSGLITINLGSDNGLTKGNTLHVYRLQPRPTYVGLLRIMDVREHEAVGKLTTSATRPGAVQIGDEVASKILDNR